MPVTCCLPASPSETSPMLAWASAANSSLKSSWERRFQVLCQSAHSSIHDNLCWVINLCVHAFALHEDEMQFWSQSELCFVHCCRMNCLRPCTASPTSPAPELNCLKTSRACYSKPSTESFAVFTSCLCVAILLSVSEKASSLCHNSNITTATSQQQASQQQGQGNQKASYKLRCYNRSL